MSRPCYFLLLLALVGPTRPAVAGELLVNAFTLNTTVDPSVPGGSDSDHVVTNPFIQTHFASVSPWTAQSQFAFSWQPDGYADFLIEGQHVAGNGPTSLRSSSNGGIGLIVSTLSLVTIDATYTYALGNGDRRFIFAVTVGAIGQDIFAEHETILSLFDPPNGTLTYQGELLLQPGVQYGLSYTMRHNSFSGSPDSLSTGSGTVHFSIVPIAEPASATLLLLAAPLILRRRRA